jgi:hypothetical protein
MPYHQTSSQSYGGARTTVYLTARFAHLFQFIYFAIVNLKIHQDDSIDIMSSAGDPIAHYEPWRPDHPHNDAVDILLLGEVKFSKPIVTSIIEDICQFDNSRRRSAMKKHGVRNALWAMFLRTTGKLHCCVNT